MTGETANTGTKDQAFFAEEASRQILQRVANVLSDPDICDATFIVEDGNEKEEINAPSQLMAICSPYFKALFYPPGGKEKKINGMQPKTFRKILDYLFRGRVPLSSIEDAWKVKVAGRTFQLKELEELCTKFLQYRIDSRNLIHFLKNTTKYDTPDLRDVVISRFLKNAEKGFEDEQILDLTEDELLNIMSRKPEVQARKVMDVLIKWGKKKYAIEAPKEEPKIEEPKKEDKKEETKTDDAKTDEAKKEEKKEEPKEGEKKDDTKEGDKKEEDAKTEEDKKDETKKEEKVEEKVEEKKEDKKTEEKPEEKKVEEKKTEEKPTTPAEINLVLPLQALVKYVTWDNTDAPYYLKEIRGKPILSMESENNAMTQMLQAFVDNSKNAPQTSAQAAMAAKMGPKSTQQQRGRQQGQKRDNSQECEVITERISKNSRTSQRVKQEDDIL